ncbi:Methyltransferase domain [Nesidiocoris tenuis]|uniref:tRNA N(3)-methylcytidine methyltransferase n=1 Tax=Nesidiocoris tenuis TaxID=355587 RepID=A0ABN7APM3_9HEMI|nr:Methyltransferase domain [Nesidiocoris tenuis]
MTSREDDLVQSYSSTSKVLSEADIELLNKQNSRLVTDFASMRLEKDAKKHWDYFYKRNENRFFKDRHWIMREFPELEDLKAANDKRSLLEVGCGVGNLFYPLLEEGLHISVHACDFSPRAVDLVKQHPLYDAEKINAFQADLTQPDCLDSIRDVDIVTMVFVLSAIHPEKFALVLRNVFNALKPGGVVLFRDYGLYDMTQIRFKPGHKIADNFYMRQDGTRSYFFTTSEVEKLFSEYGFHILSNQYVNRRTVNLKEEVDVPRIYVQAKFQKPEIEPSA